ARLDRQRHLARRLVDRGDLGVDLFAHGEPVGPLFGAVARQFSLSDEARHAVTDRALDAAVDNSCHRSGDDIALLVRGEVGFERIGLELRDAERDAVLFDVDVQDAYFDRVALVVCLDRLFSRLVPVEVGEVDHAVDLAGQADEQAELGDVLDLALELGPGRIFLPEAFPGILHALFEAEGNAALRRIDIQHHHLDLLAGRDDLARMHVFLGPAHFGDMDQAFDARLQLDECAIVGNVGDAAPEFGTRGVLVLDAFPRIGLELFHAERDAMRLRIETHHLHLDALADMQGLRRMVDAPPRDVGDMQQTVDAAKIDERAVIGDVLHDAGQDLAFLEAGDQLGAGLGAAFLEHRTS